MIHQRLILSVSLALLACTPAPERREADEQPAKSEPREAEAPPAPVETHDLARFGMPSADTAWTNADYSAARKAVTAIAKEDAKLLPRAGSPEFARMADVGHLRTLAIAIAPEQLAGLSLSLGALHTVYGDRVGLEPEFEQEHLMLTAAVLVVTSKLLLTTASTEDAALALRDEPSRLQGMLQFRHGIHEMIAKMLEPAPSSVLARGVACEQLARVIDDVGPLLLDEERTQLRGQLKGCEGASAEVLAALERGLASDAPSAALVLALAPEHRDFKSTRNPN